MTSTVNWQKSLASVGPEFQVNRICILNGTYIYIGSLPIMFCKIVLHDLLHVGKPQDANMYTACSDT